MDLFTIAAAATRAEVSVETIRNYCRLGLLHPARDSAGRRLFTIEDVHHIREIHADKVARRS